MPTISVCVATYRRPELLATLLESFATHDFGDLGPDDGEFVIVDNDAAGTGLEIVDAHRDQLPFPVITRLVREQNISRARNAAVAAASGNYLLFIDDDELPEPGWATTLVACATEHAADVVCGPVLPRYAAEVPPWVRDGGFFAPRVFGTGEVVPAHRTYTSNALVRARAIADLPGPFDVGFGVTGAEDSMLFWDVQRAGGRLVWCAEAQVSELVPESRATRRWLIERAYSGGQNYARLETFHLPRWERVRRATGILGEALCRLPIASAATLAYLAASLVRPRYRSRQLRWERILVSQCGKITGSLGRRYTYYR